MGIEQGKKVVLAVDDVSINLAIIKNLLSKNYDVRVAKSGEQALFILGSVKVDLILLDIEMPGMSGFEFINILREKPNIKDTPIIFVTSNSDTNVMHKAIQAGVRDYIVKPINANVLKEKVFKVLEM